MGVLPGGAPAFEDLTLVEQGILTRIRDQLRRDGSWPTIAGIAGRLGHGEAEVEAVCDRHGDVFATFSGTIGLTLKGLLLPADCGEELECFETFIQFVASARREGRSPYWALRGAAQVSAGERALHTTLARMECSGPSAPVGLGFFVPTPKQMPGSAVEWLAQIAPYANETLRAVPAEQLLRLLGDYAAIAARSGSFDRRRAAWLLALSEREFRKSQPIWRALTAHLSWAWRDFSQPVGLTVEDIASLPGTAGSVPAEQAHPAVVPSDQAAPIPPSAPLAVRVTEHCLQIGNAPACHFDQHRLGGPKGSMPRFLLQWLAVVGFINADQGHNKRLLEVHLSTLRTRLRCMGVNGQAVQKEPGRKVYRWNVDLGGSLRAGAEAFSEDYLCHLMKTLKGVLSEDALIHGLSAFQTLWTRDAAKR